MLGLENVSGWKEGACWYRGFLLFLNFAFLLHLQLLGRWHDVLRCQKSLDLNGSWFVAFGSRDEKG